MRGRYIVLEGPQGSGKTSQIALLAEWLRGQGIAVHTTREPGGADVVSRTLRQITQNPSYSLNSRSEVLLYNAARAQLLPIIDTLLKRGVWVICDHNYLTTLAVQYHARGDIKSYKDIERICMFAVGNLHPDITFVLDIDAGTAKKRTSTRYRSERFDKLSQDFLQRVRNGYLSEAKKRALPVVDANQTQEMVLAEIKGLMQKQFSELKG